MKGLTDEEIKELIKELIQAIDDDIWLEQFDPETAEDAAQVDVRTHEMIDIVRAHIEG